jgi:hypothetical protein
MADENTSKVEALRRKLDDWSGTIIKVHTAGVLLLGLLTGIGLLAYSYLHPYALGLVPLPRIVLMLGLIVRHWRRDIAYTVVIPVAAHLTLFLCVLTGLLLVVPLAVDVHFSQSNVISATLSIVTSAGLALFILGVWLARVCLFVSIRLTVLRHALRVYSGKDPAALLKSQMEPMVPTLKTFDRLLVWVMGTDELTHF